MLVCDVMKCCKLTDVKNILFGREKYIYLFQIIYFHDSAGMLTLNVENIKALGSTKIFFK